VQSSYGRLGSSIVLGPGFPVRALGAVYPASVFPSGQEPLGPPTFFAVSLPTCRGLWTPADRRLLANAAALVSPSVRVTTLGVRNKLISKLYQHFRVGGHPYGLQDALPTLRPSCSSWSSSDSAMDARLDTGGWLALTRQGLSPCKIRQAFLGATTLHAQRRGLTHPRLLMGRLSPKPLLFPRPLQYVVRRSIREGSISFDAEFLQCALVIDGAPSHCATIY
jgi:hypothetical protein